jgi:hypothetical protein
MMCVKALSILILTGTGVFALVTCKNNNKSNMEKVSETNKNQKGFAVLELFTSEGCSSCPPADKLMAKIQNEYKNQAVYILAFHVDYWDRLGWKDVFSAPDNTNRQQEYEKWFNTGSIYTPQLVVNGMSEFVGSNEFKTHDAIKKALATEYKTRLSIESHREADKLILKYTVSNSSKDSRILVVIVQKSATTKVERGENKGRLLSHIQIVRGLHSETISSKGNDTTSVQLPKGFNSGDFEVIALVQDSNNGEISAVTRLNP